MEKMAEKRGKRTTRQERNPEKDLLGSDILENKEKPGIPDELPILPLRGTVVYPTMVIPLLIAREKSIHMINKVLEGDRLIGLVAQKNPEDEDPAIDAIFSVGIAAQIIKMIRMPDDSVRIMIEGMSRIRIREYLETSPFFRARI